MQVKNPKCFIEFHIELEFELELNSSANIPILGKGKVGIFDNLPTALHFYFLRYFAAQHTTFL
jgi:hypothetical protein